MHLISFSSEFCEAHLQLLFTILEKVYGYKIINDDGDGVD
jgi:hypothetical protein